MIYNRIKIPANWKKAAIPLILFSFGFILALNEKTENINPICKAVISQSGQTETDSKDVNPNSSTPNSSAVWIVAAEIGHSSVKQFNEKPDKSAGLARHCAAKQDIIFTNCENTLAQINSDLGRQFTLLGEKPSGTS